MHGEYVPIWISNFVSTGHRETAKNSWGLGLGILILMRAIKTWSSEDCRAWAGVSSRVSDSSNSEFDASRASARVSFPPRTWIRHSFCRCKAERTRANSSALYPKLRGTWDRWFQELMCFTFQNALTKVYLLLCGSTGKQVKQWFPLRLPKIPPLIASCCVKQKIWESYLRSYGWLFVDLLGYLPGRVRQWTGSILITFWKLTRDLPRKFTGFLRWVTN